MEKTHKEMKKNYYSLKTAQGWIHWRQWLTSCFQPGFDEEDEVDIPKEIVDFQNRLYELIKANPLTANNKVRLISLPPLPFDFEMLKTSAQHYVGE